MQPENLDSLRKQLIRIAKEEICNGLRTGKTDLETVAVAVEERASTLIDKIARPLARAEVRHIIAGLFKKTAVPPTDLVEVSRQLLFSDMEEFRGIPPTVTYNDAPNHVAYISYLDTLEAQRGLALALLGHSIATDQQTYLAMKAGNEFAASLVARYGDLPLWDLYLLYKTDQQSEVAQ